MKALPEQPFELSVWKRAKVQLNYHISIEKMNYSVPYEYVGNYVDVKVTKKTVTVYYKMNKFVPMIDYMVVSINTQQMKVICRRITKNFNGTKTVL